VLYVRGQHSSLVNVFYRLGVAGGVVFLLMNWILIIRLARASTGDGLPARLSLISCGLIVLTFFEISSNVGLESPRYLINYTLAISLSLVCLEAVRAERRRLLRRRNPRHATIDVRVKSSLRPKGSFTVP
jgi:hypothetical protein